MDLLGPVQRWFYYFNFFYIKENKIKQDKTWQLEKRKEKLLSYNGLYKVNLINPWFGTQRRISVCQVKVPNILNYLLLINGSQDIIVSILSNLTTGRPRSLVQIPAKSRCFVVSHLVQTSSWTHTSYFLGFQSDHPPPSSARTINQYAISSLAPIPSQCVQG